jgi:hypothetical protein
MWWFGILWTNLDTGLITDGSMGAEMAWVRGFVYSLWFINTTTHMRLYMVKPGSDSYEKSHSRKEGFKWHGLIVG